MKIALVAAGAATISLVEQDREPYFFVNKKIIPLAFRENTLTDV